MEALETYTQGRNEVRCRPRQEASLALQYLNLSSFESKFSVLKKVLVTFLGLVCTPQSFRRPHSDFAPGELFPPCTALVTHLGPPVSCTDRIANVTAADKLAILVNLVDTSIYAYIGERTTHEVSMCTSMCVLP